MATENNRPDMDTAQRPIHRRKWLKRTLIALGILLLLVVVALGVVIAYLGPIVERYAEDNDKELLNRRLEMDNLSIDIFSGVASVDNLTLYEEDETTPFAKIGHADLAIDLMEVLDNHIHITEARLTNPYLGIDQQGSNFNFDSLMLYIITTYLMGEDDGEEWNITIENVTLQGGELAYHDLDIDQRWVLSEMSLRSDRLWLDDHASRIDATMKINDVAELAGALDLNIETFDFLFAGTLAEFPLADTYKYWTPYLNIHSVEGTVAADMQLEGNVMDIFGMKISGEASAENFAITDCRGDNLLSATSLRTDIDDVNINAERYLLRTLHAEGFATQFVLNADGTTNLDDLFYGEPDVTVETTTHSLGNDMYDVRERVTITTETETAPLSSMTLHIGDMRLHGGSVYIADRTMHKPFEYRLHDMAIESKDFDIVGNNTVSLRTGLQKQGSALIEWRGSLTDFYNQNLLAMLTNVNMQDFSPYIEYFTAFPVSSGNLTFRSQNVVTNGALSGVNNLGTHNFHVGNKDRSLDAEYKLPMKAAIFILADGKDNINLDMPISGRIDSPEFSYRKIIWKAIGNVVLKVIASPFMWMAGDKQDAFRHIDVKLLEAGFNSEHYARLDEMAQALKEDANIKVRLTQRINYHRARYDLAELDLKIAYYNSTQSDADERFDMLDFERIRQMRLSRKEVSAFADSQLIARGIDPAHLTSEKKAMALYGDMVDGQLTMLMTQRNRILSEYMEFQHSDLRPEAFSVNEVVLDDMKQYTGKDRYTVTLIIDDEEIELAPIEETVTEEQSDYYDAYALEEEEDVAPEDTENATDKTNGTDIASEDNLSNATTLDSAEATNAQSAEVQTE